MKKKKFLLTFSVLTALCALTAGAAAGCGKKHEHSYTKWDNDETQHWLVCPDDNAKDGSSVADHEFGTDGKCVECGYEKPHTHAYTKWRMSDTEHWKVCPDDNTEGPGTRAPHNFVNGTCECGKKDNFSGEIAVDERFNGKTITLKKEGQTDVALTVAGGKVTLTNVKLGEWTASCDLFGATLKTSVTIEEVMTVLDLSGFTSGTAKINLDTGAFTWHRQGHETAKVNLAEEATGDQYVALKIATADDFLVWAAKLDEIRFGVAMTVNGAEHIINFNWRNWERTNIGFSSDIKNWQTENQDKDMGEVNYRGYDAVVAHFLKPNFQGWDDKEKGWSFGTYGGAIIEDGVYFIYQYEAATGNVNIYLSDGETYILVYTEEEMFEKNGKFQGFGVTEGETDTKWAGGDWNTGIDRDFTFTIGYGTTVNAAVGGTVSEWKSTVNITGNKADVDGANVETDKPAYGYGETATVTVTVPANKVATVTVDGGTPVVLEATDTITIAVAKTEYTVNVVFASDKFTGEVTVDQAFNGKTVTLKKEGQTDLVLTVAEGKVTLTGVKLGEWTATCDLLGTTLKGSVTLTDGMTTLDLSGFNSGTADMNLTSGAFVYTSKKDNAPTVNVNLAEAKTGDAYVGLKISTAVDYDEWTLKNFEELHLGVWMTVGDSKHWIELHWRNWEQAHFAINTDQSHDNSNSSTEILKKTLWKPVDGFTWDNNHGWTAMPFGEAFSGDGIYLIMKYNSATGNVDVLLAKDDGYVKVCTFKDLFAANGEVKAFGVGSIGEDLGYHNTPGGFKIDCVLSIGSSLSDITGSELNVLTNTPVLTVNSADIQGATAVLNKSAYEIGETGALTVTVPKNYKATVTIGGKAQDVYASGDISITVYDALEIGVEFTELNTVTKEVAVNSKLNGTNLVLKRAGYEDISLPVTDGKVSLNNVCVGPWDAEFQALGRNVKVECFINEEFEAFPWLGTADMNLTTGEFVYTSQKDNAPTVNVNLVEAKTGDTYVGLKLSTDCTAADLTNKYEELHLGVWMTVGDSTHWVELHWRNWQAGGLGIHTDSNHNDGGSASATLKDLLWKPTFVGDEGGSSYGDGNHNWEFGTFGNAFLGDGIYLIMKYETATGNVDVLLAKSDGYVKVCTIEKMFAAGGEVKGFGVGAIGNDWGFHEAPGGFKIDCVLSVGSSLSDITGDELSELQPETTQQA